MNARGQGRVYLHHGDGNVMGKRRQIWVLLKYCLGFPGNSVVKNPPANAGLLGLIPGLEKALGGGNGNPCEYSCLENPMDRGTWWARVHRSQRVGHDSSVHACMHILKRSDRTLYFDTLGMTQACMLACTS